MVDTFEGWWESQKGILWLDKPDMSDYTSLSKQAAEAAWFEAKRQCRELLKMKELE